MRLVFVVIIVMVFDWLLSLLWCVVLLILSVRLEMIVRFVLDNVWVNCVVLVSFCGVVW